MTIKHEESNRCPVCGGRLKPGRATIPFLLSHTVVLIKDVPAEICSDCHEPYMVGIVTDRVTELLGSVRNLQAEVLILSSSIPRPVPALAIPVRV